MASSAILSASVARFSRTKDRARTERLSACVLPSPRPRHGVGILALPLRGCSRHGGQDVRIRGPTSRALRRPRCLLGIALRLLEPTQGTQASPVFKLVTTFCRFFTPLQAALRTRSWPWPRRRSTSCLIGEGGPGGHDDHQSRKELFHLSHAPFRRHDPKYSFPGGQ